jgi:hypothetical protein
MMNYFEIFRVKMSMRRSALNINYLMYVYYLAKTEMLCCVKELYIL